MVKRKYKVMEIYAESIYGEPDNYIVKLTMPKIWKDYWLLDLYNEVFCMLEEKYHYQKQKDFREFKRLNLINSKVGSNKDV